MHGGSELTPGQVPHRALVAVVDFGELAPASGAFQLPVSSLASDPQVQDLILLVNLLPVHAVAWAIEGFG